MKTLKGRRLQGMQAATSSLRGIPKKSSRHQTHERIGRCQSDLPEADGPCEPFEAARAHGGRVRKSLAVPEDLREAKPKAGSTRQAR